jgi:acyl dehydratase
MLKIRKIASKFTRPVEQGWEVKCTGRVAEKHFICKGKNFVVIEVKAENQHGDVLAVGEYEVVFPD